MNPFKDVWLKTTEQIGTKKIWYNLVIKGNNKLHVREICILIKD